MSNLIGFSYVLGSHSADGNALPDFHFGVLWKVNGNSYISFNVTKIVEKIVENVPASNAADIDNDLFTTIFYIPFGHNASALSGEKSSTQFVDPDILTENVLG